MFCLFLQGAEAVEKSLLVALGACCVTTVAELLSKCRIPKA
jgi:Flp pilus assembly pilin Flp